ncbi:4Fe-4S dicluster domain-containing protein [Clostridium thermobutyricum]|uniref:Anaerobic sulfite reductase subunit A n=1 Tax=Clostridium thermobutyricum DSM 4928 TaxID=1121339 RepID=A0A1V4ST40_9CLOT|nr:4Fe-4S dicluster domain-containing protein [Clostridium thermobutyricum]OPX46626.1 anaerobic sulfite reductase subunit A [Clostridium thermobutyricum DSM 4928]
MDFKLSKKEAHNFLLKLQEEYKVFGPKAYKGEGRYSDIDSIRYGEINSFDEVVYEKKSNYSPKEVLLPINHLYAVKIGEQVIKNYEKEDKKKLIILRSCDIHAIERLDKKFSKDEYYNEKRKGVKFIVMECPKAFDTCYCLSVGTNKTDNYSMGIRFLEDGISIKIKDSDFDKFIDDSYSKDNFELAFATENTTKVNVPHMENWDKQTFDKTKELPLWKEYSKRCIGCGSCNISCPTCTCLTTKEVKSETSDVIEIRRIWNGCQLVKSNSLKKKNLSEIVPTRIRQRVLDKFYMSQVETSNEQDCVGCGRCTDICPRLINFSNTVNRFSLELDKIYEEEGFNN